MASATRSVTDYYMDSGTRSMFVYKLASTDMFTKEEALELWDKQIEKLNPEVSG